MSLESVNDNHPTTSIHASILHSFASFLLLLPEHSTNLSEPATLPPRQAGPQINDAIALRPIKVILVRSSPYLANRHWFCWCSRPSRKCRI